MPEATTPTGHVIGAVYLCSYWGYTYQVLGPDGEHGVTVKCLKDNPNQQIAHVGEIWSHGTRLDRRDKRIS